MPENGGETVASPSSTLHCCELECDVKISSTCSTQQRGSISSKNAVVTLGRNLRRSGLKHVSYLLQNCTVHGKMVRKGCGSVEIPSKQLALLYERGNWSKYFFDRNSVEEIRQLRSFSSSFYFAESMNEQVMIMIVIFFNDRLRGFATDDRLLSPSTSGPKKAESVLELTAEQKAVVRSVIGGKKNVFFTGSAGTGKSLVLRRIIELLPAATTFVTASTGVAACFIGGSTLHSFGGFGNGCGTKEQCAELVLNNNARIQWKRCQHLIIDEISMIDADYFEKLEYVARKVKKNDKPFGGIQLVITGDFLQLPPVTSGSEEKKFCFMCEAWSRCITETFLLRQVKRQSDDTFIKILEQVRVGRYGLNFESFMVSDFSDSGVMPTHLCTHAADVDLINANQLKALSDSKRFLVVKRLSLKIGAQVMLIKNLDLSRSLSNGSRGVVKSFSSRGYPIVNFLAPDSNEHFRFQVRVPGFEEPLVRIQLPLQLAWALSIHKSQGLTLDAVELSLSRVFADGQAYVALSRARSLDSVRLLDFNPTSIRANADVMKYYERQVSWSIAAAANKLVKLHYSF
ncbi:unnamed protein product [Enterobius vermicularis]|uniref:ATP-dependent DNA helicase n=1 Tax=Enterobius vermicularis TaxID=51028 RepID=A0A0N4VCX8_ENTVE|nr:unnamed protein product [Enterobius vermicularis]